MGLTRRRAAAMLVGTAAAASAVPLLAACSGGPLTQPTAVPTPDNPLVKPRASGAELTVLQASSELALGRNRFAIGLLDARNQAVLSGDVLLEFFKLKADGTAEKRLDTAAQFRTVGQAKGVWVAPVEFDTIGPWGAQVTAQQSGVAPRVARMNFEVREKFSAPGYGEPAIRSASLTERDADGDASRLCTNSPPCALHKMSIAEALASAEKPLVIAFATPALCTSATCGPELDAVLALQQRVGDRANFVHVEIYQYPFDGQRVAAAVEEWRLPSEPWTFVVDRDGTVHDRFEGAAPADELEPALASLLT